MKKIFISHSTFDKEIAEVLVKFLKYGLGISSKKIFCSSLDGHDIPIGVNFNDYIRNQIANAKGIVIIPIISNHYYNSKYCLYELGAAWGLGKGNEIYPFLIKGMKFGNLQDFISHTQSIDGTNVDHINKMSDQLKRDSSIEKEHPPTTEFEKERELLIHKVKKLNDQFYETNKKSNELKKAVPYKLVALDFDGVILQGKNYKHSWKAIWDFLYYEDSLRKSLYDKHRNNHKDYTFKEWCTECVGYFKERSFKKENVEQIFEKKQLKIADGFNELIIVLNRLGIKVIIISGGIDTFITSTIDENILQLIDKVFVNKFIYNKDGFLQGVEAYQNNNSDSVGKSKTLENYCIENKINLSEVVYVGDEINDIDAMLTVGKAIVYPGETANYNLKDLKNGEKKDISIVYNKNIIYVLPEML